MLTHLCENTKLKKGKERSVDSGILDVLILIGVVLSHDENILFKRQE
jgi:hypothetical protein